MPRVLHVVLSLRPGGAERLVIELCRRTAGVFESAVCCLDEPGRWAAELPDSVHVLALRRRPGFRPALARQIAEAAGHTGAIVLHCHQYSPFVYGTLARLMRPDLRVVTTEHGRLNDDRATLKRRVANRLMNVVPSETFAVSHALRDQLIREGFPARRVGVVPNGIEPGPAPTSEARQRARAALNIEPQEFAVGAVGRLDKVKDFGTLIDAFARLVRLSPRVRLVVIGDGPDLADLTRRVRDTCPDGSVILAGHRHDVRELLPGLDLFASSSVYEGVPLTLLEAMAAALPVVATRVGGTPEVVVEYTTGILVPPRNPAAMAAALASLMADAKTRGAYGSEGRARIIHSFNIDAMVRRYAEIYRRLGAA